MVGVCTNIMFIACRGARDARSIDSKNCAVAVFSPLPGLGHKINDNDNESRPKTSRAGYTISSKYLALMKFASVASRCKA